MAQLTITPATSADAEIIYGFIAELAEYEKLSHELVGSVDKIRNSMFGRKPVAKAFIARLDAKPVGYALYFYNYSTFLTQPGVYLEDLYVKPEHRGAGIGKALLRKLAQHAVSIGAGRLEWSVLDWNEPSIQFYKSLGAVQMDEWTVFRLTGEALETFGKLDSPAKPEPPILKGERITLRPARENDAPFLHQMLQDPRIEAGLGMLPWPYTLEDAKGFVRYAQNEPDEYCWILTLDDDIPMGNIHLSDLRRHKRGYLGYWLGTDFWGHGYMPEAIKLAIDFGFNTLGQVRIEAEHFAQNEASGRAMQKAGMTMEGIRKKSFNKRGQQHDLVMYGITAS